MPYLAFGTSLRQLGPGVLTIGSAPEAGWRVLGHALESRHAIVSQETGWGGRALIEPGSPTAVIFVNGAEVPGGRITLEFDDVVKLGTAEFTYRRVAPGSSTKGPYLRDRRRGRVYLLTEHTTIGRDQTCTIMLTEPDVSRTHAEIIKEGDAYIVRPHGVSVVSLNGVRVPRQGTLREGDDLSIGGTTFRFTTDIGSSSTVSVEPRRTAADGQPRRASVQTMYVGTVEARDWEARVMKRKVTHVVAIALSILAVTLSLVYLAVGARQSVVRHRHHVEATTKAGP